MVQKIKESPPQSSSTSSTTSSCTVAQAPNHITTTNNNEDQDYVLPDSTVNQQDLSGQHGTKKNLIICNWIKKIAFFKKKMK